MTDNGISIQKKSKGNKRNKKSDNQNAKQNQNEKDQMYWVRNDQKADEIVQTNDNDQNFVNNDQDFPGYQTFDNNNTQVKNAWQEDDRGLDSNVSHLKQLYPDVDYEIIKSVLVNFNNSLQNAEFQLSEMFKPSFFAQAGPDLFAQAEPDLFSQAEPDLPPIETVTNNQKGKKNKKGKVNIISKNNKGQHEYESPKYDQEFDQNSHKNSYQKKNILDGPLINDEFISEFKESDYQDQSTNYSTNKVNNEQVDEEELMKEMQMIINTLEDQGFFKKLIDF